MIKRENLREGPAIKQRSNKRLLLLIIFRYETDFIFCRQENRGVGKLGGLPKMLSFDFRFAWMSVEGGWGGDGDASGVVLFDLRTTGYVERLETSRLHSVGP